MPNIKSAIKRVNVNKKKNEINKSAKSEVKTALKKLNALIEAAPEVASEKMTENVKAYMDALADKKAEKPVLTDSGKLILKHLQGTEVKVYKAKEIADELFVSSERTSHA